jgi:SAM-dependent methyltransferase
MRYAPVKDSTRVNRRSTLVTLTAGLLHSQNAPVAQQRALRAPDIHYEPSSPEITQAMLRLAGVKKGDVVYDLGCGDGRVVIAAAKQFGTRGVGIDIDPLRIEESIENAKKAGVNRLVSFRNEDLFEARIAAASVVTLYLWPSLNLKLRPKLLSELNPGSRVVSHSHDMGDWLPQKEIEVHGHRIYLWTIQAEAKKKK